MAAGNLCVLRVQHRPAERTRRGTHAHHVRGDPVQERRVRQASPGGRAPLRQRRRLAASRGRPRRAHGGGALVPQDAHPRGGARHRRAEPRRRYDRLESGASHGTLKAQRRTKGRYRQHARGRRAAPRHIPPHRSPSRRAPPRRAPPQRTGPRRAPNGAAPARRVRSPHVKMAYANRMQPERK